MTGRSAAVDADEAGALEEHRRLLRQRRVGERTARRGHQRRLHLLGRPGRVALEEQSGSARDVRRGEARAGGDDEGVSSVLGQGGGQDVRSRRGDVGLERMAERRQAAGGEARRDARPGRGNLEPVLGEADRHRTARPRSRRTEPGAVEVGDRAARPLEDRESGIAGGGIRDDHADGASGTRAIDLRLVRAAAPADERDRSLERPSRKRTLAEEPTRPGDRAHVDQALVRLSPCLRDVVRGDERESARGPRATRPRRRRRRRASWWSRPTAIASGAVAGEPAVPRPKKSRSFPAETIGTTPARTTLATVSISASVRGSACGPPPEKLITSIPSCTAASNAATISGVVPEQHPPSGSGTLKTR